MKDLMDYHKTGLKGIINQYIVKKILKSKGFIASIIITFICYIYLLVFTEGDCYVLLEKLIEKNILIFPTLLGFCIAGYAIIVGFTNNELFEKMSKPLKSGLSYFQVTSCIFAFSIIIQMITFLLSYLVSFIIDIGFFSSDLCLRRIININIITIIIFLSIYSILLLYYMVINLFTFGQMMHFCVRKKKLDDDKKKRMIKKIMIKRGYKLI